MWVLLPTKHLDHVEDAGLTCLADADASIHAAVFPLGQGPGNRRLSHFWTTSGWDWEVLALSDNLRRFFPQIFAGKHLYWPPHLLSDF